MRLKEIITHPLTYGSFGVTAILQLMGIVPIWDFVASTSSYWFPALATTGATILPELGYQEVGTTVLLTSAIVFVLVQLDKFADKTIKYLKER